MTWPSYCKKSNVQERLKAAFRNLDVVFSELLDYVNIAAVLSYYNMNTLVVRWIKSPINYQVRNGHEKSRSGNNLGAIKDQRYKAKTSHWLPIIIHMLTLLAVGLASFPLSAIEPQPVNTIAYQAARKARMALSFQVALLDDAASSVSSSWSLGVLPALVTRPVNFESLSLSRSGLDSAALSVVSLTSKKDQNKKSNVDKRLVSFQWSAQYHVLLT